MEAFEGGGNVKDALKDLEAARRRAAENQEQAKSAIRDLTEKNQWLEAGFAEERSKAEASAKALEASREETMRLKQRIGELEGELRGLKEVGGGDQELRERMRELEAELKVMRENADEELRSRLKEADANLLLVEEAQKRIAALEEEKRSREREVQSLQERVKAGENTVKDLEASATSRHATEVRIHFPLVCASHRCGVAWLRYNDGSGKGRFRAWQRLEGDHLPPSEGREMNVCTVEN
jgi:chromosome segregation ATPase